MGIEYRIKCKLPKDYDPWPLLAKLPSPMKRGTGEETYNYKVEEDGFYLIDHLNERKTAAFALQLFVDDALQYSETITIEKS